MVVVLPIDFFTTPISCLASGACTKTCPSIIRSQYADMGYPYEFIAPGMRILDYGCNDCTFLDGVSANKQVEAFRADKNRDLVVQLNRPNVVYIEKGIPFLTRISIL